MSSGSAKRYTLLYRKGQPPPAELRGIAETQGVQIIDQEIARALLIETDERTAEVLRNKYPDWIISPEVFYPRPDLK